MKRLLVPAALAGCLAVGIWTGYAWPVGLTLWRWMAGPGPDYEDDVVA